MRKVTIKTGRPRHVAGVVVTLVRIIGSDAVIVQVDTDDGAGPDDEQPPRKPLRESLAAMKCLDEAGRAAQD